MSDTLTGGFPDVLLRIKLGRIRRQRQKLKFPFPVSPQVSLNVFKVRRSAVPDEKRLLPPVWFFQLFKELNRFLRILPMGLAAVALSGFNVKSSVKADGLSFPINLNLGIMPGGIPDGFGTDFFFYPALVRYQYHTIFTGIPLEAFFNLSSNLLTRWGFCFRLTLPGWW